MKIFLLYIMICFPVITSASNLKNKTDIVNVNIQVVNDNYAIQINSGGSLTGELLRVPVLNNFQVSGAAGAGVMLDRKSNGPSPIIKLKGVHNNFTIDLPIILITQKMSYSGRINNVSVGPSGDCPVNRTPNSAYPEGESIIGLNINNPKIDCNGNADGIRAQPYIREYSKYYYINIPYLLTTKEWKDAPPDIYIGDGYSAHANLCSFYCSEYQNTKFLIKLDKKSYVSNLSIEDNMTVRVINVNNHYIGYGSVDFILNGLFNGADKLNVNISSAYNFNLIKGKEKIPYSITIDGEVNSISISNNTPNDSLYIRRNNYISGKINVNFSVKKNEINAGIYKDTITVIMSLMI